MVQGSVVAVLVVCLTLVACGEIPEPEGFTVAPPVTAAPTGESEAELSAGGQATPPSTDSPGAVPGFLPQIQEEYVPEVLVAADGAVLTDALPAADGTVSLQPLAGPLATMGATRAFDDLLGGVVVQQVPAGDEAGDVTGDVVWVKAEGAEGDVIATEAVRLLDVSYVGGSPVAVVQRSSGRVDGIRLVDPVSVPVFTPGPDEELLDLSASGGLHAVVVSNAQCGDLRFYRADGGQENLPGPGEPDCIVPRRPAYGAVALSPDGASVAYTVVSYRNDGIEAATEVVVRDLGNGIDFYRRKIGEDGDRIGALSFDGNRVLYLRESPASSSITILYLNGDRRELPLTIPADIDVGSVSFARFRLASG